MTRRFALRLSIPGLLLLASLAGGRAALAQTHTSAEAPAPASSFTPKFKDVDITVIAEAVSQATGTTIILGPGVKGKFSIVNIRPITAPVFYLEFVSMLKSEGFKADRAGDLIKVTVDKPTREHRAGPP